MSYDIAQLKLIPIASILKQYGIEVYKRSNTEYVCDCPLASHSESSKDNKRSFSMGLNKQGVQKWFCHSLTCQKIGNHKGGDGIDLIARLDNLTNKDALKKLSDIFCIGNGHKPLVRIPAVVETNKPLEWQSGLRGLQSEHPYIQARGVHVGTAWAFGVGYYECPKNPKALMHRRVAFPLRENNLLIGYTGRTIDEPTRENPKWLLPPHFVKSILFGLERCKPDKPLVIVESPWTVLQLCQDGYQAASLLGCALTEAQEKCLAPFPTICVEMDADEPGREANEKIAERLKPRHRVYKALWHG
jgi:Toprim-like